MKLKLYTKENCFYCYNLKINLESWGYDYEEVNIEESPKIAAWLRQAGHKTVPQLYLNGFDMMQGESTDLTQQILEERISELTWGERAECDFNEDWKPV